MRNLGAALLGLVALIYLLNPGMGVFELLPDSIPGIGNLDEATAAVLLIACLRYFGIDLTRFLRGRRPIQ